MASVLRRTFGRGHFPHQLSWLIDNPARGLFFTPKQLANRLPIEPGSSVLELGPGSGYLSVELARRVPRGRLELLDLQPEMLAKARLKLEAHGLQNVGYTAADAGQHVPFPDESFDVAVMVAVLGEVPDQSGCLRNLHRTIRPDGTLAIHEHIPDPDRIRIDALQALVEAHGFRFASRLGPSWNYTALFKRTDASAV